jgi:type I restriction enzyme, S subunit
MEVKAGYKRTEVGIIPEDWDVSLIADVENLVTSGSRGWAKYYSDRGSPFLRITNLTRNSIYIDLNDLKLVCLPLDDTEGLRTQLQDGDVLLILELLVTLIRLFQNPLISINILHLSVSMKAKSIVSS